MYSQKRLYRLKQKYGQETSDKPNIKASPKKGGTPASAAGEKKTRKTPTKQPTNKKRKLEADADEEAAAEADQSPIKEEDDLVKDP